MKKQLFTLALSAFSLGAFCQSTVWQPYNSNVDTSYYVKLLSVVDTNTVWGLGYAGTGSNNSSNQFTRTIDGADFHSGTFLPDTNTFNPSNISAVSANTAFISLYDKAADGTSGQILKTTDGGTTWTNIAATGTTSTTGMFIGAANFPDWVHFWNANNGVALGDPNGSTTGSGTDMFEIWRTNNGGTTWTRVADANVPAPNSGEFGINNSFTTYKKWIWSGTSDGRVYASADSGKTWTVNTGTTGLAGGSQGLAFRDSLHGLVWGSTLSTSFVFGILSTSDGGNTWTNITPIDPNLGLNYICAIPKTKGYMSVGLNSASSGYVTSVSYDDGVTWTALETGTTNDTRMLSVQMLDSLNGWAGCYSTNTLPYGTNGMDRFHLGHKLGCPITLTSTSTSTPFNVCSGGSATITASGLNTYTWSTSATTASITVTPTVSTSYSVAGTTTAGCSNYETFSVSVINPSIIAVSHTVCPFHSVNLSAFGATTYSWTPSTFLSSTTGSTVTCTPTVTTIYTVTGTEDLCTAQKTFTITAAGCVGIEQISNNSDISIYPNPSNGLITINLASVDANTVMYVTNLIGEEISRASIKDINTNIDLTSLQKGIYMLTITNGLSKHIEKIIIQ